MINAKGGPGVCEVGKTGLAVSGMVVCHVAIRLSNGALCWRTPFVFVHNSVINQYNSSTIPATVVASHLPARLQTSMASKSHKPL